MERIVKLLLALFILLSVSVCNVCAETSVTVQQQIVQPQVVQPTAADCIKTFQIPYNKLFFLTLAAANEYNYKIKEIQTKSGYIIFETGYRKYLAGIIYVSAEKSILKITPYSGNYDFPPNVPQSVFKYVEQYKDKTY